jgi:hypothetical protein
MNRTQRHIALADKWNKEHGVSAEHLKKVNDLFRTPVIAVPITFKNTSENEMINDLESQNDINQPFHTNIKEGETQ